MSVPNKSVDKNKRYAGVKANDFVNKPRAYEANRSAVRPQGWANLGKINSRRVPPPANLPSLKSETGVNSPTFDPTVSTNHGWTSNDNQSSINIISNPTQQQIDSLPVSTPSLPSSASPSIMQPQPLMDIDKPRMPSTWNTITSGTKPNEQIPSLLPLNDFPRLATTPDRKYQSESIPNIQSPSFRPTNLSIWKDGGSSRVQDIPSMIPNNIGANPYHQSMINPNMRMFAPPMWAYNPYPPVPLQMHQQPPLLNSMHEYKTPTILKNKDIEDLSKLTDNTWANSTQEVNYEEKIRFSDDDDDDNSNRTETLESMNKSRRMNSQILQHSRLIQDDVHLKQMQDNKNSELMNALNIAKQRRDEQERNLKNEQLFMNNDERKQVPGYQTRPLLSSNEQENLNTTTLCQGNKDKSRSRHDTANSQSSFTMKSWSDQMDSFNYSSLHEKTRTNVECDESTVPNKYSRSPSESSIPSQQKNENISSRKLKKFPLSSKKQQKTTMIQGKMSTKKTSKLNNNDFHDNQQINMNEQWENWEDSIDNNRYQQHSNDNHRQQQSNSEGLSIQKPNRLNKQSTTKLRNNERQQTNSRIKSAPATSNKIPKTQTVWRPLSPNRPVESTDPTPQESISYRSQQRTNLNEHKQRHQTTTPPIIDTSSIPPLMSVRSDATVTASLFKSVTHTIPSHYNDENMYYKSNLEMHHNYHHGNMHNRGYTTLGFYGRYRRTGATRHQPQYTSYNINNTSSAISSSIPNTNSGTRQKKNSTNKFNNKTLNTTYEQNINENKEILVTKSNETSVLSTTNEVLTKDTEKLNDKSESKQSVNADNESNVSQQTKNGSTKINKKPKVVIPTNSKKRTNKNQHNYHQDQHYQNQQPPRHRNNYSQSMQDYDSTQMNMAHTYYSTARRSTNNIRNTHMHDQSTGYYYGHPKQHYNNHYNYTNDYYQQQRSINKTNKRNGGTVTLNNRQQTNGNTNSQYRHQSTSDNDQKEGEEWETASESSTNMRNDSYDSNAINTEQPNELKSSVHHGRTPPKKSFSNQRPNARQILKYTNA